MNKWSNTWNPIKTHETLSTFSGTPFWFFFAAPSGTPGISETLPRTHRKLLKPLEPPSQDPCGTLLSTLRSTDQKECLYKSMNRWAVTISPNRVKSSQLHLEKASCLLAAVAPILCHAYCSNVTTLPSSSHPSHWPAPFYHPFSHASPSSDQASGSNPRTSGYAAIFHPAALGSLQWQVSLSHSTAPDVSVQRWERLPCVGVCKGMNVRHHPFGSGDETTGRMLC